MRTRIRPWYTIVAGVLLMVVAVVLAVLMVVGVVEPTLFLNFLTYVASVAGLLMAMAGTALQFVRTRKRDDDWW